MYSTQVMQQNNEYELLNTEVFVDPWFCTFQFGVEGFDEVERGITTNFGKAIGFIMFQIFIRTFKLICKQS